ncbi:MAG: S8 family serine peptidase [Bacteroidales bacterium]|nr:S8 family serine peptidase [Bacteroidales bacterium]
MKIARYIMLALSVTALASCRSVVEIDEEISIKDAAVKGELLVKFSPEVADILESAIPTKAGIPSVDEIFDIAGAYEFERVFPVDPRNEERTREAGLHLWYIVRFDAANDIEEVGRRLAALGEVSGVEYNHTIKRAYNPEKRAIPYDISAIPMTKAQGGVFDDPMLGLQWNLINTGDLWERGFAPGADVNAEGAWEQCTGDPSVIVAIVDEGVFYDHPDLRANMWHNEGEIFASEQDNDGNGYTGDYYGYNFVKETGQISYSLSADTGHGTHVAGVIAAQNNNGVGISSIAGGNGSKPGVKIMSCQIFSGNYVASILAEVKAIKYAADNGAVILQCSWGYTSSKANQYDWAPMYGTDDEWMTDCPIEKDALFYFVHTAGSPNGPIEGGIGVFAAGNESAGAAGYPGAYGDFVSVIGTAPDLTPAVYTNYGTGSNICAPGGDQDYFYDYEKDGIYGEIGCILSTVPYHISESGYAYMEGSSMATPHVSSALALAISYAAQNHRHLKADDYKKLLEESADPIGEDLLVGPKYYYKYVADLGQNQKKKMELEGFRGRMGAGQLNVGKLLGAVKGAGVPMVFPNIYVAPGASVKIDAARYFDAVGAASVTIKDSSIADASVSGSVITFVGKSEGVTSAVVSAGGENRTITVTVRKGSGAGWL